MCGVSGLPPALAAALAGLAEVCRWRVRNSSAWRVVDGAACLDDTPREWLLVRVHRPGTVRITAGLLPAGGTRC